MKWVHAGSEIAARGWAEASARLTSLADRADPLVTGQVYQEVAANVAEYYDIRLATLDYVPLRVNGQLVPGLPSPGNRWSPISAPSSPRTTSPKPGRSPPR
jgi:UDP:flavonoid glycosyltransferase YjiC (YdhE family)